MFRVALFVVLVFFAGCSPQSSAPLPEQEPEILAVDAARTDDGNSMQYMWEVNPNSSTADTWLWVWLDSPEPPDFPRWETLAYDLEDCSNGNVTCHGPSRVQFEFVLPATSGGYTGTVYYQVYVGSFQEGGPTTEVDVSSAVYTYEYP